MGHTVNPPSVQKPDNIFPSDLGFSTSLMSPDSPMSTSKAKTFQATLERTGSPLKWVVIRIPFDVFKLWGARGQFKVKGEINGFAFRTSLFPAGNGKHTLLVNKKMQAGAGASPGSVARLILEPDTEERNVDTPVPLKRLLAEDRSLHRWFERLNHSTRADIARWISEVKSEETRERRAEQLAERLMATMEAERELPPILQVAFARNPRAREGWEMMSAARRRGHLLGIFYYRNPESRARRIEKALQEAADLVENRSSKKKAARRPAEEEFD